MAFEWKGLVITAYLNLVWKKHKKQELFIKNIDDDDDAYDCDDDNYDTGLHSV